MARDVQVVEDGVSSSPDGAPSPSSWVLGVVGFVLGLGLGVLVVGSTGQEVPEPDSLRLAAEEESPETTLVEEVTEITPPDGAMGVVGAVPDFPDAIVAIARTATSALDHVLWPRKGEVRVRSMTGGEGVALDATSQFIAVSDGVPGLEGDVLSMGRFNSISSVASGVLSYAWHDSRAALLSYTDTAGENTRLLTTRINLAPEVVVEMPSADAMVAAWGDWGWAINQQPNEIVLLTPQGDFKDSEPGVAYASHPSGWVFATEETSGETRAKLVSAGGGVRRIETPLNLGDIVDAAFSPNGSRVAIAGSRGLAVLDVETDEVSNLMGFATSSVSWSSDSRFVLAPASPGVLVIDLEEQPARRYHVLGRHSVVAVSVVPLRSS